ncbi:OmpW family outer membrane protein [Lonepinella sp. BR2474]|uniref:OmpW family outer membrane protein n=1 Tax=Lonepinella sp. BR2474 TaxID=3434548 RepID=UPI003F6E407D
MKKTALALIIGALAVATSANATNWYVQGDLGYSKNKFTSYPEIDKSKFEPRLSVGYDFGDFRLAVDYTHYGKFSGTDGYGDYTSSKIYGIGFSGIYDFEINSDIKPYVGVRLASNVFKTDNSSGGFFESKTQTKFGYGALVGAQYKLDANWAVNGGIEYNRLGSFEDTKVNNYGAKVGIRYNF